MKETLSLIRTSSLHKAVDGINAVLDDLKEALGEDRLNNSLYFDLLRISTPLDWEYLDRANNGEDIL